IDNRIVGISINNTQRDIFRVVLFSYAEYCLKYDDGNIYLLVDVLQAIDNIIKQNKKYKDNESNNNCNTLNIFTDDENIIYNTLSFTIDQMHTRTYLYFLNLLSLLSEQKLNSSKKENKKEHNQLNIKDFNNTLTSNEQNINIPTICRKLIQLDHKSFLNTKERILVIEMILYYIPKNILPSIKELYIEILYNIG
ncbi:hypothetical protein SLOPH_487, partial [Spraguea lophii 42_110]